MAEFRRWGVGESTDEILDDGGEWWLKESMKITLFALFVALLMVGCGSPNVDDPETLDKIIAEAIDADKLQGRGKEGEELIYAPNNQTPFTGWAKSMYDNEQIKYLIQFKDGKKDGLLTEWFENGQKRIETNYKDGNLDGLETWWYENGQKDAEFNYKDGKLDGLVTKWYENGQKELEHNYKDGKFDGLATNWYENGQKHQESNYKDGKLDGLVTKWYENGTKHSRKTYKDGEEVED